MVTEISINDTTIFNPGDIAEALNTQFKSVITPSDDTPLPEMLEYNIEKSMQIIPFEPLNVTLKLRRLYPNKYVGPGGVHPQTSKETHLELAFPLTKLSQKSLDIKQVREDWKNANIVPVYKSGSRNIVTNFQIISNTSKFSIILEGIMKHLTGNKLFTGSHYGLRS